MRSNQNLTFALILTLVLLFLVSCAPKQVDQAKVRQAIQAADEKWMAGVEKGDAAALAALYTEDAKVLPPNSDFVTGTEAIQTFMQGAVEMGIKSAKLEILEVEGFVKTAYEVGKYTLYGEAGQTIGTGKYIVIWKQVDGQWKLHRDIWNSSVAPTPPLAP